MSQTFSFVSISLQSVLIINRDTTQKTSMSILYGESIICSDQLKICHEAEHIQNMSTRRATIAYYPSQEKAKL